MLWLFQRIVNNVQLTISFSSIALFIKSGRCVAIRTFGWNANELD